MKNNNQVKVRITIESANGTQTVYRTGSNASAIARKEIERAKKTHAYVTWEIVKKHNEK